MREWKHSWSPGSIIALALILFSVAGGAAQAPLETRGAWRLVADGEDFVLRTQAIGAPDTTFSLYCRGGQRLFVLELKSPTLAAQPRGEGVRIAYKVDDADRVFFNVTTGPDGTVPVTDLAHRTAFWIIQPELVRKGAQRLAFSAGDHTWQFALDGYADLNPSLHTRCKFAPIEGTRR